MLGDVLLSQVQSGKVPLGTCDRQNPRAEHADSRRPNEASPVTFVIAATVFRSGVWISAGAFTPYPSSRCLSRSRVWLRVSTPAAASPAMSRTISQVRSTRASISVAVARRPIPYAAQGADDERDHERRGKSYRNVGAPDSHQKGRSFERYRWDFVHHLVEVHWVCGLGNTPGNWAHEEPAPHGELVVGSGAPGRRLEERFGLGSRPAQGRESVVIARVAKRVLADKSTKRRDEGVATTPRPDATRPRTSHGPRHLAPRGTSTLCIAARPEPVSAEPGELLRRSTAAQTSSPSRSCDQRSGCHGAARQRKCGPADAAFAREDNFALVRSWPLPHPPCTPRCSAIAARTRYSSTSPQ